MVQFNTADFVKIWWYSVIRKNSRQRKSPITDFHLNKKKPFIDFHWNTIICSFKKKKHHEIYCTMTPKSWWNFLVDSRKKFLRAQGKWPAKYQSFWMIAKPIDRIVPIRTGQNQHTHTHNLHAQFFLSLALSLFLNSLQGISFSHLRQL